MPAKPLCSRAIPEVKQLELNHFSSMDKTFRGAVSAAEEQSRRKADMVARGDGKFGPWGCCP